MPKTTSQVKDGLRAVAERIAAQHSKVASAKQQLGDVIQELGNLSTEFSDVIAEIQGYPAGGSAFEVLSKDELAKLTSEFQALRTATQAGLAALP